MTMKKMALLCLVMLSTACSKPQVANSDGHSNLDFISFNEERSSTLLAVRESEFRLCVRNQGYKGDMEKQKQNAMVALLTWYRALRQIDPKVQNNIKQSCSNSHMDVLVFSGGNRSSARGHQISVFADNGDGSILHEMGHAFAGLSDTYDTGAGLAGRCVPGQPQSVMCWGMYGNHDASGHSLLYKDDIDGIQANYTRVFRDVAGAKPDTSIDPTTTLDINNPWPGGAGGNGGVGLYAKLGPETTPNAADLYVSVPVGTAAVFVCTGAQEVCKAAGATNTKPGIKLDLLGQTKLPPRSIFKSSTPIALVPNANLSFFTIDATGIETLVQSASLASR